MVKFYKSAESAGIKPIIGVDVWLAPRLSGEPPERLTLLVQNDGGYRNLAKLLSAAYTEGQGTGQPLVSRESLVAWNGGLIAMTGRDGAVFRAALGENVAAALEALADLRHCFADRLYLEKSGRAHV